MSFDEQFEQFKRQEKAIEAACRDFLAEVSKYNVLFQRLEGLPYNIQADQWLRRVQEKMREERRREEMIRTFKEAQALNPDIPPERLFGNWEMGPDGLPTGRYKH